MANRKCLIASDEEDEDGDLIEIEEAEGKFVPGEVIYLPEDTSSFQPENEDVTDPYREDKCNSRKREHSADRHASDKKVCLTPSNQGENKSDQVTAPIRPTTSGSELVLGIADTPIVYNDVEDEIPLSIIKSNVPCMKPNITDTNKSTTNSNNQVKSPQSSSSTKSDSNKVIYHNFNLKASSLTPKTEGKSNSQHCWNRSNKYSRQATPLCDAIMKEYSKRQRHVKNLGQTAPDLSDSPIKELISKVKNSSIKKPEHIKQFTEQFSKSVAETKKSTINEPQKIFEPNVDPSLPKRNCDIKSTLDGTISDSVDIKPRICDLTPRIEETNPVMDVKPIIYTISVSSHVSTPHSGQENKHTQLSSNNGERHSRIKADGLVPVYTTQPELDVKPVILESFSVREDVFANDSITLNENTPGIPCTESERFKALNNVGEKFDSSSSLSDFKIDSIDNSQVDSSLTQTKTQTAIQETSEKDLSHTKLKSLYVPVVRISEDVIRQFTKKSVNINFQNLNESQTYAKPLLLVLGKSPESRVNSDLTNTESVVQKRRRGRPPKSLSNKHQVTVATSSPRFKTNSEVSCANTNVGSDNTLLNIASQIATRLRPINYNKTSHELLKLKDSGQQTINSSETSLLSSEYQDQLILRISPGSNSKAVSSNQSPPKKINIISTTYDNTSPLVQRRCAFIMNYLTSYQEVFDEHMFKHVIPSLSEIMKLCLKYTNEGILRMKHAKCLQSNKSRQEEITLIKQDFLKVLLNQGKQFFPWFNTIAYKSEKTKASKAIMVTFIFFLSGLLYVPNFKEEIHRTRKIIIKMSRVLKKQLNPIVWQVLGASNEKFETELEALIQILEYFEKRKFVVVPKDLLSCYAQQKFTNNDHCSYEESLFTEISSEYPNPSESCSSASFLISGYNKFSSDQINDNQLSCSAKTLGLSKSAYELTKFAGASAQLIEALQSETQFRSKRIEEKLDHILNLLSGNRADFKISNYGPLENVSLSKKSNKSEENLDLQPEEIRVNEKEVWLTSQEDSQAILTQLLEDNHAGLDSLFELCENSTVLEHTTVNVKSECLRVEEDASNRVHQEDAVFTDYVNVKLEPESS